MDTSTAPLWSRERLGLSLIAASLVVIVATTALLLFHLREGQEERLRGQGIGLIRVLSTLPYDELVPASNPAAVIKTVQVSEGSDHFAYASITDLRGTAVIEAAGTGVIVPTTTVPSNPTSWMGERVVTLAPRSRDVLEFFAPLFQDGEHIGHLRIGYYRPGWGLTRSQTVFTATIALVIFLLTPLFYFLVRREIKPLEAAGHQLKSLLEEGQMQSVTVTASGELGQFMTNFNRFVDYANQRVAELESEQERVLTSTRLLSYRKERMYRVIESFPEGILLLNDSGVITLVNAQIEALFGVAGDQVVGDETLEWCKTAAVREYLGQCRVGGRYLPEPLEFELESSPGKTFVITVYPLFKPDNSQTMGSLVVVRDITVEVLARRGRAEFVAHVAHELKTPLNVLALYSEALQNAEADDEETRIEAANVIEEEVGRLSALINNMLNITKIEMGSQDVDTQRVRLRDLLEDVFNNASLMRQAEGLEFDLDLPTEISAMELDKDLMRIALNNFLTNAVKYNTSGGRVSLSAEELEDIVRIRISDTGIGIAQSDLPRIFDKFYRSDDNEVRDRSGHGLGLALARDIIELHNGSVSVESTLGEGTSFTIDLWKVAPTMRQVV